MIVGFHGRAGAGKDTAALILQDRGWPVVSFSERLKAALNAIFGWSPEMWQDREWKDTPEPVTGQTPRDLLITLGTSWGRQMVNAGLWVKLARLGSRPRAVVPDVRFENEAQAITEAGGIIIEIVRPNNPHTEIKHFSENRLPDELIDHTIVNDGTGEDLHRAVTEIIESY